MLRLRNSALALFTVCATAAGALGPAQAAAGWHPLANVTTAVGSPAVGAVNGIIYVAGGTTSSVPTAAVQAYNPTKNTWSAVTSLPETLYQTDGAATIDSLLYVTGGWNGALPTNTLYAYNPSTNSWAAKATLAHLAACGISGVINSLLYVTTGCNGNTGYSSLLDVYNPATNTWTSLAPSTSAHAAGAGAVINGQLYVTGGIGNSNTVTGITEVYNPATNKWKALANLPTPVQAASSVELGGQLYVIGGTDFGRHRTDARTSLQPHQKQVGDVDLSVASREFGCRGRGNLRHRVRRRRQRPVRNERGFHGTAVHSLGIPRDVRFRGPERSGPLFVDNALI